MKAIATPIPTRADMFKEMLQADLAIFINLEEFSEEITLDGVTLPAQITTSTKEKSARLSENFQGLHGDFITVYFKTADYCAARKRLPNYGEYVILNGKRYVVESSSDEGGIAKLVLSSYRQNSLR